jgi:hypothetical protein
MGLMTEPVSENLIDRYLRARGRRYFRGQHDGEYFFLANAGPQRLHVHLEICRVHPDVFTLRVTPACFFPVAERARLTQFAKTWNRRNSAVSAIVHESSAPQRIGVIASKSHWIGGLVRFDDFAGFVDRTLAAAIDLFGALTPVPEPASTPLLRDAC